ncbi:translation initiation factor IF-2-like [Fukomys damarensis]|uniref:translation initiation factor IF-2-like n=1 Tax=Fukomys damarensis TaxID=885580 RepID=UPI001455A425|nr:translation initiation factor IF-2-like [Fukomys damarensis]
MQQGPSHAPERPALGAAAHPPPRVSAQVLPAGGLLVPGNVHLQSSPFLWPRTEAGRKDDEARAGAEASSEKTRKAAAPTRVHPEAPPRSRPPTWTGSSAAPRGGPASRLQTREPRPAPRPAQRAHGFPCHYPTAGTAEHNVEAAGADSQWPPARVATSLVALPARRAACSLPTLCGTLPCSLQPTACLGLSGIEDDSIQRGVVVHACNPSIGEAEAGGWPRVQGHPELQTPSAPPPAPGGQSRPSQPRRGSPWCPSCQFLPDLRDQLSDFQARLEKILHHQKSSLGPLRGDHSPFPRVRKASPSSVNTCVIQESVRPFHPPHPSSPAQHPSLRPSVCPASRSSSHRLHPTAHPAVRPRHSPSTQTRLLICLPAQGTTTPLTYVPCLPSSSFH